jgi:hypothetical protein
MRVTATRTAATSSKAKPATSGIREPLLRDRDDDDAGDNGPVGESDVMAGTPGIAVLIAGAADGDCTVFETSGRTTMVAVWTKPHLVDSPPNPYSTLRVPDGTGRRTVRRTKKPLAACAGIGSSASCAKTSNG